MNDPRLDRIHHDAAKPIPKVVAAGFAGAVTVILVWVAGMLGLEVPEEVAAAVTALLATGAAYLKR
jgi:hypothetical protein